MGDLLDQVGSHAVDPVRLLNRIPDGMHIRGLRDKLLAILADAAAQLRLREGCKAVLKEDKTALLRRQLKVRNKGVRVHVPANVANIRVVGSSETPVLAAPLRETNAVGSRQRDVVRKSFSSMFRR